MNIAVLSGKGGTGKTFVSVNLASAIKKATYIDCDVEEPNGHIFLKPEKTFTEKVNVSLPEIMADKCNGCRKCVDFCKFNALAFIKNKPIKFKDVCHACGGCKIVCPNNAIVETKHSVGEIICGKHNNISVISGVMNTGEESGVPIIKALMEKVTSGVNVIDCPPGSACTVLESIENADYCIIVAEPTIFGVHNFLMVYELVRLLKKPFGVVINKDDGENNPMRILCEKYSLPIIARIKFDNDIAKANASGKIASEESDLVMREFEKLYKRILEEVSI